MRTTPSFPQRLTSLAFLRFTRGELGAVLLLAGSVIAWIVIPSLAAVIRLRRSDL